MKRVFQTEILFKLQHFRFWLTSVKTKKNRPRLLHTKLIFRSVFIGISCCSNLTYTEKDYKIFNIVVFDCCYLLMLRMIKTRTN